MPFSQDNQGEHKLYATLRIRYWWKRMRAYIRRYFRGCLVRASRKGAGRVRHPPLKSIPIGGPFHMVGVDVLQLPTSFAIRSGVHGLFHQVFRRSSSPIVGPTSYRHWSRRFASCWVRPKSTLPGTIHSVMALLRNSTAG